MNIVRGVTDFILRSSGGQSREHGSASQSGRFSLPTPVIIFSEVGDEAILKALWEKYLNAVNEGEKRKSFHIFLKQFLTIFRNWKPVNVGQTPDEALTTSLVDYAQNIDVAVGCSFGHPPDIILILTEEVSQIARLFIDNQMGVMTSMNIASETWMTLDALIIVTRSIYNCKVFGYYAGIQKLTALMKAAVVQLKTITSAIPADESPSDTMVQNAGILQKVLVYVVSIICNFIDLDSRINENIQLESTNGGSSAATSDEILINSSTALESPGSEAILLWHQTTVVSVMEAGGLNWLLDILRLIRRLVMKEQWVDMTLQYLTLKALRSALADNTRGQNHFRSIGGLEVLLDGLGIPSIDRLMANDLSSHEERGQNPLQGIFDLHVLSLEVLREATFGNINNLQFLCENGRVHKFGNSFCSVAFILPENLQKDSNANHLHEFDGREVNVSECKRELSQLGQSNPFHLQGWKDYVAKLSAALCCFVLDTKESKFCHIHPTIRKNTLVSAVYAELSVKWLARVLHMVFPFIKACSDHNEIPSHLRIFAYVMQHYVLFAYTKVLLSSPSLLEIFRKEHVWNFIFSDRFFYFDPAPAEFFMDNWSRNNLPMVDDYDGSSLVKDEVNRSEVGTLQLEVVSFMEFAATLTGSPHNLPECTVLLDALEKSACNPGIATVLARTLLRILKDSVEKTASSFKTLHAIPRMLKVACIQVQKSKRSTEDFTDNISGTVSLQIHEMSYLPESQSWEKCMKTLMDLFAVYFSTSDDAKISILSSSLCISCMFDLFWEEGLRNLMLKYILDLMKLVSLTEEEQKAKVFLCSKYLETFTHVKERVKKFSDLAIELLVGMREMLLIDQVHYQALFREGECFLHVVSLLNGNLDAENGESLVLNVIQTLTCLLSQNDASKAAFRALVGKDYQTLQSLLLDFCQWQPSEGLLSALLDMLVDGKFNLSVNFSIKNEDVILLYLSVLQKSSDSLQHHGLDIFLHLLRDSLSNQASCVRAGMLNFLLNWFSQENDETRVLKISQLIQVIGGHSISGKDIRKIFALLRSETGSQQQSSSLLLNSMLTMLNEKGPTAFFDLNGIDSGIVIKAPLQWSLNRGFSFTCWLRVENFPLKGSMGLFNFFTENGRGCYAVLSQDKLIYESIHLKRQRLLINANLTRKKWHFLCLVHSIGRAFSGGSQLKCYLDGVLLSSEKCRYPKINEPLTSCSIGTKVNLPLHQEEGVTLALPDSSPFLGQIGPTYFFNDALSSEVVQSISSLGPSYMYYFLDNEVYVDNLLSGGVLDAKDGLASKIIFGLNAQASNGRTLFNVLPIVDLAPDRKLFEASVLDGSQLCSRRLLQQIIYCVGGVSVFFPLLTQSNMYENNNSSRVGESMVTSIPKGNLTAETIKLIASILDDNLANQQQMLLISGFSVLGFLLRSVPAEQLNLGTLSALKHLFSVVTNGGLSELLVKDAVSYLFLNPHIWVQAIYNVQREMYMFLIQQFDNEPRLLKSFCRLPRVLDIIRQFYCDNAHCKSTVDGKPIIHSMDDQIVGEKRDTEEIRKIRLLLLSLGEMSLRAHVTASDMKALVAFYETCQDMACIEDVLNMTIRAVSQKQLLAAFLEQLNLVGGCLVFTNLLCRDFEPVRLLGLQFIGKLLVGLPEEKKGSKLFNIPVGRSKFFLEAHKKVLHMQPIFSIIADRLFRFPQTDLLCATFFDVLLGGASPKQVLRTQGQSYSQKTNKDNSHFLLPQVLCLIFRFLSGCKDRTSRIKIMGDLFNLLDSNPSNIEALMENGWNAWLEASVKLDVIRNYKSKKETSDDSEIDEQCFVRNICCLVLCHYILSVKGGWQNLEETVNFLLIQSEQVFSFLRDLYEDLTHKLITLSTEENIFVSQPCRDNTLYLVKLVDEMLISEMDQQLPYPASNSKFPQNLELDNCPDINAALCEALKGEIPENLPGTARLQNQNDLNEDKIIANDWWNIYDNLWVIIGEMNGKGQSKALPRGASSSTLPSLGQRARGLVESLNIPAAEMAAAVSGGISSALAGKPNKTVDKAMLLRGEKCSRFVNRLIVLYLCRSSLERASRCIQLVIPLLPFLLAADDEQSKNRLQLFIWALHAVRSQYGMLDGGARFHVISSLIRETINCGKSMLASSIGSGDDLPDFGRNSKEGTNIFNFIQKDQLLAAVADEIKYIKSLTADRVLELNELQSNIEENKTTDSNQRKASEDQIQSNLNTILASDDSRRSSFQLSLDEDQQIVAEKWIHTFRLLIDERGPWSANPFPNTIITHWKLDKTEDAWRRRQKLRRNYHFDDKLCRPSTIPSSGAVPSENDLTLEKMKQFSVKGIHRITDEASSESSESEAQSSQQKASEIKGSSDKEFSEVEKESRGPETVQDRGDDPSAGDSKNSEVLMTIPCVLVTPKRKIVGRLEIMRQYIHFFGEFLVEGTAGSSVLKNYSSSTSDPSKPENFGGTPRQKLIKFPVQNLDSERLNVNVNASSADRKPNKCIKRHRWWNLSKIKAVHWTRYLLKYTAIEIFFINSVPPIFLNFASQKDAKEIGNFIVATRNETVLLKGQKDKAGVISFVDRRLAQEMAETARESWRRREITNFEYLMILNTLSGRSYNDLTQYPVFPWVLADYSSETLDLNKSSTFRDLSKPVGALDPKRFQVFEDRYHNFVDPDIPSFYYGSHYSSMGIVLYYLLRLEPFTSLHRKLQGGKFDHADRLFQSIDCTYRNCLSNTSDVKELIPEFFYMPEFLINSNSYHFGVKQDGEPIGDVCLPPWAKGSPDEFIRKNREALESEYVSSNLHHWIDLVFGYKQRGKPAVEAANVFYYLTYEGAVNMDEVEDDLQRAAIEDQILNFGQTPIQIFRKKHPRKGQPVPIAHPLQYAPSSITLTSVVSSITSSPVVYVNVLDSYIISVHESLTISVKLWLTTQLQSGGNFTFSTGHQDPFFGIGPDVFPPSKIGSPLADKFELGPQCFATLQTPSENFLISCGNWENSFQVISLSDGRMMQSIRQHKDVVSCVAVTADGSVLATGSYDTTVMLWEVVRVRAPEKRSRNARAAEINLKDYVIADSPFHILCGHDDIITCLYTSAELDLVISGSKDGTCIFHTLQEGRYIRSILHPSGRPLSKLAASRHGRIVLYGDDLSLHLFSINGRHISTAESNGRLSCLVLSCCGNFLVCAGEQGQITVRSMLSLEILAKYNGMGKWISSLTVTPEECFIAGAKDGSLLVYSIENPYLNKTSQQRNSRTKASVT